MRNLYIIALCLLLAACSKSGNTSNSTNPGSNPNAMQYYISGVSDISVHATDSVTRIIGVGYTSGDQEKVTLSLNSLPANVSVSFDPASGIPPYTSVMRLNTTKAAGGTYPINMVTTTASNTTKTFDCTLKIDGAPVRCSDELVGNYTANYTASRSGKKTESLSIYGDNNNQYRITFSSTWNYPGGANAIVDCSNKKITIPKQNPSPGVTYLSVEGTGSYNSDSIVLDYVQYTNASPSPENVHAVFTK